MTMDTAGDAQALALTGLDGSNPLAFLAALGTLRSLSSAWNSPPPKLGWRNTEGWWMPFLCRSGPLTEVDVLQCLDAALAASKDHHARLAAIGDDLSISPAHFRDVASNQQPESLSDRPVVDFLAAFACDSTSNENGDIQDTAFRTMAGAGHQHFLSFMRNIAATTRVEHLRKTLFGRWQYDDPVERLTMRWDPNDDTRYALQWRNPSGDPLRKKGGNVLGANRLAIEALPLFPTAPVGRQLATTGFRGRSSRDTYWTWPIWGGSASVDVVRSLLSLAELQEAEISVSVRRQLAARGVVQVFRAQRLTIGKVKNFSPSVSV